MRMSILFINGSPNKNGNTVKLAERLLAGKAYDTLHLVDYKLYSYGQKFADDQFGEIAARMKEAEGIVIGSPVYWHNMSGAVRNLLDRFYGPVNPGGPVRKKMCVPVSGRRAGAVDAGKGRIYHRAFCPDVRHGIYRLATNEKEAEKLAGKF